MSVSPEERKRYFQETAIALRREGFRIEPSVGGRLGVWLDDHPICEVDQIGGITYRSDNIPAPEYVAAKDKAYRIVCTTAEYMRQTEQAPPLKASGLEDSFKVLADFNGTVLAGTHSKYGVQFVTWDWDYDRKGVSHGHYFTGNYEGAKQDFATRSGLIPEQWLFKDEQLIEIYRCCADTLDAGFDLTCEQEKCIKSVQEQIENGMPDIMDRIREQDQHTAASRVPRRGESPVMRASAVQAAALPGEVVSNTGKQKDCKKSLDIRGRSQCSLESQGFRNQNGRPLFLWYQDLKSTKVAIAFIWAHSATISKEGKHELANREH